MRPRHLILERPPQPGQSRPTRFRVCVNEQAALGPWITALAARCGYPLMDAYGFPLSYHLRSISGDLLLFPTGTFAEVSFPSGSRFLLEPERQWSRPIRRHRWQEWRFNLLPLPSLRFSRRAFWRMLAAFSGLGIASGVMTAFAQRFLQRPGETRFSPSMRILVNQHGHSVRTLAWSPDGYLLASGGDDGVVSVWRLDGTLHAQYSFPSPIGRLPGLLMVRNSWSVPPQRSPSSMPRLVS